MIDWNEIREFRKDLKENEFFELIEDRKGLGSDYAIKLAGLKNGYKLDNISGVKFQMDSSKEHWKIRFEVKDINKREVEYNTRYGKLNIEIVNNKLIIFSDNKSVEFKIVEKGYKYPYVYKFLKRQVNVKDVNEFIRHFGKLSHEDDVFHYHGIDTLLNKLYGEELEVMKVLY